MCSGGEREAERERLDREHRQEVDRERERGGAVLVIFVI